MKLPYCVYILMSQQDGGLYIGSTSDLSRRLSEHYGGKVLSTASRRPFELIYAEYHKNKHDCARREMYLKTSAGRKALKNMLKESLKDHE